MNIYKTMITAILLMVGTLMVGGAYFPDTFLMSLAGTDTISFAMRSIIVLLLVTLLVTNPPRARLLRAAIGFSSVALLAVSVAMLFNYQLSLLDAIVFIEVAIIGAIEALETRVRIPVRQTDTPAKRIPVLLA